MGFGIAKVMLLLQLSVLLVNCFTVSGEDIATISTATAPTHNHYPAAAPTQPPSHHHHHHPHPHPPTVSPAPPHPHPPTVSPAHPPSHKGLAPAHSPGHHHHHHHPHPPSPSPSPYHHIPAHPPSHTPASPPPHAPASPPPHAPASPPPHAPASPPPHAPVSPPPHAPASPPPHAPASPPPHPPVSPPHTPASPPPYTPAHPPRTPSPRSFVAVQGVVYCKSCKYAGVDTLLNATAVLDATVKLQCNNTKYPLVLTAKTDKNGYFFISAPKTITTFGAHKCKVSLISSPVVTCNKPSNLHYGLTGALLKPQKPFMAEKLPFFLYNVGPFAFEPKCYH